MNMALTTSQEPTNEIASPAKFIPNRSKDFTRQQTQAIRSIRLNYNLLEKINEFDYTDSKMEKKFV